MGLWSWLLCSLVPKWLPHKNSPELRGFPGRKTFSAKSRASQANQAESVTLLQNETLPYKEGKEGWRSSEQLLTWTTRWVHAPRTTALPCSACVHTQTWWSGISQAVAQKKTGLGDVCSPSTQRSSGPTPQWVPVAWPTPAPHSLILPSELPSFHPPPTCQSQSLPGHSGPLDVCLDGSLCLPCQLLMDTHFFISAPALAFTPFPITVPPALGGTRGSG